MAVLINIRYLRRLGKIAIRSVFVQKPGASVKFMLRVCLLLRIAVQVTLICKVWYMVDEAKGYRMGFSVISKACSVAAHPHFELARNN